jgi:hypothetical protein
MHKPFVIRLTAVSMLLIVSIASAQPVNTVPSALATLKARVMSADYRADIDGLVLLRDQFAHLGDDPDLGYLAHYWSGYAKRSRA